MYHELLDHAMEDVPVVVTVAGMNTKILHCLRATKQKKREKMRAIGVKILIWIYYRGEMHIPIIILARISTRSKPPHTAILGGHYFLHVCCISIGSKAHIQS